MSDKETDGLVIISAILGLIIFVFLGFKLL